MLLSLAVQWWLNMTMVAFNLPSKLSQIVAFKVQSLFQALQSPYGSLQYSFQALQSPFNLLKNSVTHSSKRSRTYQPHNSRGKGPHLSATHSRRERPHLSATHSRREAAPPTATKLQQERSRSNKLTNSR